MDALVIGCGVIGLSTAVRLQEAGLSVEIWTANLPEESTSIVAAATWYPYRAYPEDKVLGWGSRTYTVFEDLAGDPQSGVHMREGIELSQATLSDPWWGSAVRWLRRCGGDELPPGYRDGYVFNQPVIEMPIYLRYLLERFTAVYVQDSSTIILPEVFAAQWHGCGGSTSSSASAAPATDIATTT